MIDTLYLHTQPGEFKVGNNSPLTVQPAPYNYSTGDIQNETALFLQDSKPVTGRKAYINDDFFNLDIDGKGLFIHLTPMKYLEGTNFKSITQDIQLMQAMSYVEAKLKEYDIGLNINEMELSRIDLCRTIPTKKNFLMYEDLFRFLSAKRMKKREYGTTHEFSNKSRKAVFYDKIEEMKIRKDSHYKEYPGNWLRGEMRFLNKRTVKRDTQLSTLSELYQPGAFEHLHSTYKNVLSDVVFRTNSVEQLTINFEYEIQFLEYLKESYSRQQIDKYIQFKGIDRIVKEYGSFERFRLVLERAGFNRVTVWRKIKEIQEQVRTLSNFEGESVVSDLYNEIYTKLVA